MNLIRAHGGAIIIPAHVQAIEDLTSRGWDGKRTSLLVGGREFITSLTVEEVLVVIAGEKPATVDPNQIVLPIEDIPAPRPPAKKAAAPARKRAS